MPQAYEGGSQMYEGGQIEARKVTEKNQNLVKINDFSDYKEKMGSSGSFEGKSYEEIVEREQHMEKWARKEAHLRVKFADRMKTPQGYRTLYYGLRRNHERHVAVVHPFMFLMRRIIYALVIVFMATIIFWGVWVVLLSCILMLAYACAELQW